MAVTAARLDPITRSWAVVTAGSVARLALGFVASVLVARALGPAGFGVYAVLGVVAGVGGAFADVGMTDAAIKRVASVWTSDPAQASLRAQVFFWLRATAAALFVVGATLLTLMVFRFWPSPFPSPVLLPLTYLGIGATALCSSVSALLQATGAFGRFSVISLTNAGLTVLFAVALSLTGRLTIVSALVILGIGTALAAFAVGCRLLPAGLRLSFPSRTDMTQDGTLLLRFGRWLWLANVLAMLTAQLDVLLVNHWGGAAAVGAYALALNLAMKVDVANQSLYTVLLPAASTLSGDGAVRQYLTRGLLRSVLISLAVLVLIPLSGSLIPFFYGSAYAPAIPLFRLLLGVVIFDVLATPLLVLPYYYNSPKLLATADAVRALTLLIVGIRLIPGIGPTGAVAARLAAKVVGAATVGVVLLRRRPPSKWMVESAETSEATT